MLTLWVCLEIRIFSTTDIGNGKCQGKGSGLSKGKGKGKTPQNDNPKSEQELIEEALAE